MIFSFQYSKVVKFFSAESFKFFYCW